MAGKEEDLRVDVRPADNTRRNWLWTVYVGEEIIGSGSAPNQKTAHAQAGNVASEWRDQHSAGNHGHKKHKKEE